MRLLSKTLACVLSLAMLQAPVAWGANHREAPITAIDRAADITDFFAFVSYDDPSKVTFILNVDPLLKPANGPNYFPFDDEILYQIHVDNDKDAIPDVTFQFRFKTEVRAPGVFTGFVGAGNGLVAPANSPAPVPPGTPIIPPAITALDGPGSEGLNLRQTYSVSVFGRTLPTRIDSDKTLYAVPSNVGPRTMPDYESLARQGVYEIGNGMKVFAGTVDDPFYIDLGAAFDSLNFRTLNQGTGIPAVLTSAQDADDTKNFAPDAVSGFNVNCIAIEVPIRMLTRNGNQPPASDPDAVLGAYGSTSRQRIQVRGNAIPGRGSVLFRQVQRMGNPLINELIIGTGFKDTFSMADPRNDAQFAEFALDPLLARALNAIYGEALPVPDAPRTDLLPLVQYLPPIAPASSPTGPVADLLRLNVGIAPTPMNNRRRLGAIAGDFGGFPNGRRVSDDVTDIAARVVAGVLTGNPKFTGFPHNAIGDGVNTNDRKYQETFPYVAFANDGRNTRHVDAGEDGLPVN